MFKTVRELLKRMRKRRMIVNCLRNRRISTRPERDVYRRRDSRRRRSVPRGVPAGSEARGHAELPREPVGHPVGGVRRPPHGQRAQSPSAAGPGRGTAHDVSVSPLDVSQTYWKLLLSPESAASGSWSRAVCSVGETVLSASWKMCNFL